MVILDRTRLLKLTKTNFIVTCIYIYRYRYILNWDINVSGFEEITKGCCGTGLVEAGILCNRFTTDVCSNVSAYVFWDSFHPTQRFYKIVAKKLIERYIHHLK